MPEINGKAGILFVDDDLAVINGLSRSLKRRKNEWDMYFANSGEEALTVLEAHTVDIIVSDMRMPMMDGAELLEQVRKKYPQICRVILSGYVQEDSILKTVGPAHYYIAKPCHPKEVGASLDRILALKEFVDNGEIRKAISGIRKLPSIPNVIRELIVEIEKEDANPDKVADLISKDIALTSQILRLTNSAFFALPVKATSPRHAVSLLGFERVRDIALIAGIIGNFKGNKILAQRLETLSLNSILIAKVAYGISKLWELDEQSCGQASCAGVLSHIGSLILISQFSNYDAQVGEFMEGDKGTISEIEQAVFGTDHAKVGAFLLGLWGFSQSVVEAVAYHHSFEHAFGLGKGVASALCIAQLISKGENWSNEQRQELIDQIRWEQCSELIQRQEADTWFAILDKCKGRAGNDT